MTSGSTTKKGNYNSFIGGIYAQVPNEDYKRVSSYTRTAILLGKFGSGLTSQLLTSFDVVDYRGLNYISFSSVCVALAFSIMLPKVGSSVYFHKKTEETQEDFEQGLSLFQL